MIKFILIYFTAFSQLVSLLSSDRIGVNEGVRKVWRDEFMVRHFISHKGQSIFAHFRLHQFSPVISPRAPAFTASASFVLPQSFSEHELPSLFHKATHPEFFHSFPILSVYPSAHFRNGFSATSALSQPPKSSGMNSILHSFNSVSC